MYYRKREDKKRLRRVSSDRLCHWPAGASEIEKDNGITYLKRTWKSGGHNSSYAYLKKYARKRSRLYAKRYDVYEKDAYDLWWSWL